MIFLFLLGLVAGALIGVAVYRHLTERPLDVTLGPPLP